jgi:hypothetical protein
MITIKINYKNHTIEMPTKKFANAACRYGTDEYKALQGARSDYPNFRVVITRANTKRKDSLKGLNYEFMESYIKNHDEDGSILRVFNKKRGLDAESLSSLTYGEIKAWFLEQYPEIKNINDNNKGVAA